MLVYLSVSLFHLSIIFKLYLMKVTIRQKSGMKYLYADIVVSNIRCKCTIGISINDGVFDTQSQAVKGGQEFETNILINNFKTSIMELVRGLQKEGKLTSLNITDGVKLLREKQTQPIKTKENDTLFVNFIMKHIDRSVPIKKKATIVQYRYCMDRILKFEKQAKVKLTFDKVDLDFYSAFMQYCIHDLNLSTNSIGKLIKNIKMWMGVACEQGLHNNMAFSRRSFKKPVEESESIYLNEDELLKIRHTNMPNHHLENVRDVFILACYTGVRSQDYNKLNYKSLINDNMLKIRTEKTEEEVIVPLHPIAKEILSKYNGNIRIISNQKFNQYLKDVCRISGINEMVTMTKTVGGKKQILSHPKYMFVSSHTARRSFATNAYKSGMPTLAIMAITGHRTEKVFLHYIKVTKEEHARLSSLHSFFKC